MRNVLKRIRGTSLLEVLIAMAIMALMIVGTLQMFFVGLSTSINASNRSLLTLKAQQVAEQVRYLHYQAQAYGDSSLPTWASYLGQNMTQATYSLPYTSSELSDPTTGGTYWGYATQTNPQATNIIEGASMPYKLSYTIGSNSTQNTWVVTVTAQPVQVTSNAAQAGSNVYRFRGVELAKQKVQYVFSMHK